MQLVEVVFKSVAIFVCSSLQGRAEDYRSLCVRAARGISRVRLSRRYFHTFDASRGPLFPAPFITEFASELREHRH